MRELKSRPPEVNSWQDTWFEAHGLFVYETFLYIVAALLKTSAFPDLNNIFTSHYLAPSTERYGEVRFGKFDAFYTSSATLNAVLATEGQRFYSPAAELVKRQAQRADIPFADLIQADLLVLLMALITPDISWYPQTLHYVRYSNEFPFFMRATQHKNFKKLSIITGIDNADKLRQVVKDGCERLQVNKWHDLLFWSHVNFLNAMNLDKLDTIK